MDLRSLMKEKPAQADRKKLVSRDVTELIGDSENFYSTADVSDIKESIRDMGVLEPIIIRKDESGRDVIVSGHRRVKCCKELVAEGHEGRRYIECIYLPDHYLNKEFGKEGKVIYEQMALISANKYRTKTDWERMKECIDLIDLTVRARKLGGVTGTTREVVADSLGISRTQVGRFQSINNNLIPELMEGFKAGCFPVSVADELSKLPEKWQRDAAAIMKAKGITLEDAKRLRELEAEERQIPGQMEITEIVPEKSEFSLDDQLDHFYRYMMTNERKACIDEDRNLLTTMLYQRYRNAGHWSENFHYEGKGPHVILGDTEMTWNELARKLIEKYGHKEPVKILPLDIPEKEEKMPESGNFEPEQVAAQVQQASDVDFVDNVDNMKYNYWHVRALYEKYKGEKEDAERCNDDGSIDHIVRENLIIMTALHNMMTEMKGVEA